MSFLAFLFIIFLFDSSIHDGSKSLKEVNIKKYVNDSHSVSKNGKKNYNYCKKKN